MESVVVWLCFNGPYHWVPVENSLQILQLYPKKCTSKHLRTIQLHEIGIETSTGFELHRKHASSSASPHTLTHLITFRPSLLSTFYTFPHRLLGLNPFFSSSSNFFIIEHQSDIVVLLSTEASKTYVCSWAGAPWSRPLKWYMGPFSMLPERSFFRFLCKNVLSDCFVK